MRLFPLVIEVENYDDCVRDFRALCVRDFREDILALPVDQFWFHVANMDDGVGGKLYPYFPRLMMALCILPVANAEPERIFSKANLVHTKLRNRLKTPLMEAIVGVAYNTGVPCFMFEPSEEMLKLAPKATNFAERLRNPDHMDVSCMEASSSNAPDPQVPLDPKDLFMDVAQADDDDQWLAHDDYDDDDEFEVEFYFLIIFRCIVLVFFRSRELSRVKYFGCNTFCRVFLGLTKALLRCLCVVFVVLTSNEATKGQFRNMKFYMKFDHAKYEICSKI